MHFWDDRSRYACGLSTILYQFCPSVWHNCDLWPHLSTNRNNLGVVGKPQYSSFRKSKFGPDQLPQVWGFSPKLVQWKDIYARDTWRLKLHINSMSMFLKLSGVTSIGGRLIDSCAGISCTKTCKAVADTALQWTGLVVVFSNSFDSELAGGCVWSCAVLPLNTSK